MTDSSIGLVTPNIDRGLISAARDEATRLTTENAPALRATLEAAMIAPPKGIIPGFELSEEIHRGAQGVVYRGFQLSTKRAVAIKIMRAGPFAGAMDKYRFEREVRALLRLKHPNIVTVYDSGIIDSCCYFVMDYIDGSPLDRWLDEQSPTLETTLRLFTRICDVVHEAHVRGVIHRDLKPGNVMIDKSGEPRVLDFGLAKFETGELIDDSSLERLTLTGQFVGSLPWASPEQAEGALDRIDLRSDVYSLGVMLFYMLTRRFPYGVNGTLREILDRVVKADPLRPGALRPDVDDELDTIVLKCLNKEPARRYQTAGELAGDARRYLAGEPIEAKRESAWYMTKKIVRRHRATAVMAVAALGIILVGFVGALVLWRAADTARDHAMAARQMELEMRVQAEQQKTIAEQLRDQLEAALKSEAAQRRLAEDNARAAEAAREEAIQARDMERQARLLAEQQKSVALAAEARAASEASRAREEAAKAAAVTDFLQTVLVSADPQHDKSAVVRDVLDAASKRVEQERTEMKPDLAADIRETLAQTYAELGLFTQAEDALRTAIASRLEAAAEGTNAENRQTLAQAALALREQANSRDAEDILRTLLKNQDALGAGAAEIAGTLTQLAGVLRDQGQTDEALSHAREALQILRQSQEAEPLDLASALSMVALLDIDQSNFQEAEDFIKQALAIQQDKLGADDPRYAATLASYAMLRKRQGRLDEAEQFYRTALETYQQTRGVDSAQAIDMLLAIANTRVSAGAPADARDLLLQALSKLETAPDPDKIRIASALDSLGWVEMQLGDLEGARDTLTRGLNIRREKFGADHPLTLMSMQSAATVAFRLRDLVTAEELTHEVLEARRAQLGEQNQATQRAMLDLALIFHSENRNDEAERLYDEVLAAAREEQPADRSQIAGILREIASFHVSQKQLDRAEQMLREAYSLETANGESGGVSAAALADVLFNLGRANEAEMLLIELLPAADVGLNGAASMRAVLTELEKICRANGDNVRADEFRAKLEQLPK